MQYFEFWSSCELRSILKVTFTKINEADYILHKRSKNKTSSYHKMTTANPLHCMTCWIYKMMVVFFITDVSFGLFCIKSSTRIKSKTGK